MWSLSSDVNEFVFRSRIMMKNDTKKQRVKLGIISYNEPISW